MEPIVLICQMWNARRKARRVAEAEVYHLLRDLGPQVLTGGPLAEKKGVFWVSLPAETLDTARLRFPRLGYTQCIDIPLAGPASGSPVPGPRGGVVRWRKRSYQLARVYQGDPQEMLESAPDRREFMLPGPDGAVRLVQGYRGDGQALSRRGLPPHDARMLVNLVRPETTDAVLLDPFAGAGGIVLEGVRSELRVVSADLDPVLVYGLSHLGARHVQADAGRLPLVAGCIDAIATEPPYDQGTGELVQRSLGEMARVLRVGGRMAVFCAAWQAPGLRAAGERLGLVCFLDEAVDRKGTDCAVLGWRKGRAAGRSFPWEASGRLR